jgi:methylmalonyl-CoA mutase N-terminal domain/subunit
MSKRLQVLIDEDELKEIRRIARARHLTTAQWVRQALAAARRQEPNREAAKKLEVIRASSRLSYPTAEIEEVLAQVEKGYLGDRSE